MARILGPSEFGAFAVATVALLAVLSFNDLGVSLAIVRWRGDPLLIAPTVSTISVATSTILTIVVVVLAPWFSAVMGAPEATSVVRVMSLAILINSLVAVPAALLQREFQQKRRMVADQLNIWVGAAISLLLAVAGYGAMSLGVGRIAGTVLSAVMLLIWSPTRLRFGFDPKIARDLVRFGLPLAGSSVVLFAAGYADQISTGALLGATALGYYVLAANLSSWPVAIFSQPLRAVSSAAFARLQEENDVRRAAFLQTARLLTTVTIPLCLLLGGAASQVVQLLYGAVWEPAADALMFLGIAAATRIFFELAYDYLVVEGRTISLMIIQALWLILLIPALVTGAWVDGIRGVAAAQVLVAAVAVVPGYVLLLRGSGIGARPMFSLLWRPSVAGIVAFFVGHAIGSWFPDRPLVACLLTATTGVALVAALVLLDRVVRTQMSTFLRRR